MIESMGRLKCGLVGEVVDGVVRLYTTANQFPLIEIFTLRDRNGKCVMSNNDLQALANELEELWNQKVGE